MLKAISLHTIKQIFETEALIPLSPMAKMSYISCLMYYFEDMPMDLEDAGAFDLVKAQVKSWNTTEKYFLEMQAAGLVIITPQHITFVNHWKKHIDKNLLTLPEPAAYLGLSQQKPAAEFQAELLANRTLYDLVGMQHKISEEQIKGLILEFIKEKTATEEKYYSVTAATKHCLYWIGKKAPKLPKKATQGGNKSLYS